MTEELRPIHTERASRTRNRVASMPFVCALALAPPARALGFRALSSLVGQRVEGPLVPPDHTRLGQAYLDGRAALGGEPDGRDPDAPAPTAEPAR
jgi:hypothetical protein